MKILQTVFSATLYSVLAVNGIHAQTTDRVSAGSLVDAIRSLEEARNQAIIHGDAAALEKMTSDDYTFITLRGELLTKADVVKNFRTGAAKYQSRTVSDLKIRVYGDAAVVTGRAIQKGAENGKDYSGDYLFTRVYVRQNGQWTTVALQTTYIK